MSQEFDSHFKGCIAHSDRNATKKWCVGKAEPNLVRYVRLNDESDESTFVILGFSWRQLCLH